MKWGERKAMFLAVYSPEKKDYGTVRADVEGIA